ncbi:MAG: transaldolase [Synechococcaceae cyanobacterium SM2_3_1]|nr:transaldolase [Synechococcaceae cyanobacterium SM2_3_1]
MQLYLDSADLKATETWLSSGFFYGVTSNPLLLDRAGLSNTLATLKSLMHAWQQMEAQEIQVQAWGEDPDELLACAQSLLEEADQLGARVVIKLPATIDGLITTRRLIQQGRMVTLTAIYASQQVIPAHVIRADYLAPYLGRMQDQGIAGVEEIQIMQQILNRHQSSTRILAASLRHLDDILTLAAAGVSCFTLSPCLAEHLFSHPLTQSAAEEFEAIAARGGS